MRKQKPKRGGAREGAGRPPVDPSAKAKLIGLRLYPAELERLKIWGKTPGAAIRSILAACGIVQRDSTNAAILDSERPSTTSMPHISRKLEIISR